MVTPNKYRFILGKSIDSSVNLITNGTFTGSMAGWTVNGTTQWIYSSDAMVVGGPACGGTPGLGLDYVLKQLNVINPNQFYYFQYDLKGVNCAATGYAELRIGWSLGGSYSNYYDEYDETNDPTNFTTYTHEYVFAPNGNDFSLYAIPTTNSAIPSGRLDNVILYPYVWNTALNYEPIDWDGAKISKERDKQLNGLIIKYIADLTFIEDGYDYLYAQYLTNGFCGEVPARVEVYNSLTGVYDTYFEGIIFLVDCEFDTTKRQVKTNIEDNNASLIFIRGKDIKVDLQQIEGMQTGAGVPVLAPYPVIPIDFNNDAGAYVYPNIDVYDISILLRTIIIKASGYRLDAGSTLFSSGDFVDYCLGWAAYLRGQAPSSDNYKISIKQLFEELNKVCNLAFSTTVNADGVPKILIEDKLSYLNSTPVLTLNFVNDLSFVFDKENIVRVVNIGYDKIDAGATTTFLNTPEGTQYYTNNKCSDEKLDLVCEYIQNSIVLKRLLDGTITSNKYDKDKFLIDTNGVQTNNSGSGTFDFNVNIDTEDNMARWLETLQLDFVKTNSLSSSILTKTTATLDKIYSFNYQLTKAQFDLIIQAYNTIQFNTDGTGATNKVGYLLSADYDIKTGLTEFKLLSN